ncbi:hypothetical protein D3C74_261460 [compost metagenome]
MNLLDKLIPYHVKRGSQRFMPMNQFFQSKGHPFRVQSPRYFELERHIIGRCLYIPHLLDNIHPPLGMGCGIVRLQRGGFYRFIGRTPYRVWSLHQARQFLYRRMKEHFSDRHLDIQFLVNTGNQRHGFQRMATQFKERVLCTDLLCSEQLLKQVGQLFLDFIGWCDVALVMCTCRLWQCPLVYFAVQSQG